MKKIIVFIEDTTAFSAIEKVISGLRLLPKCVWKIIVTDYSLKKEIQGKNIIYSHIDEYYFEQDHLFDYSQSIEISHKWLLDAAGNDATTYRGISIGVILQRLVIRLFHDYLSGVRTTERILTEEEPDEIWLCNSHSKNDNKQFEGPRIFGEIFTALLKIKGINNKGITLTRTLKDKSLLGRLHDSLQEVKSIFYALVISKTLFFVKYFLMRRNKDGILTIMLPSPQALNYIGKAPIDLLLSDPMKNVLIWRGETKRQKRNLIDITPFPFEGKANTTDEIDTTIEKIFNSFIEKNNIRELQVYADLLKQVCASQIKPVVRDIVYDITTLEKYFKKMSINLVFSHADTTIRERTVISVAHKYTVPSIVLQHGSAGHYWGFFPPIATKFAAWGEITEEWFVKNGVSKERICLTGAANFDSYLQNVRNHRKDGKLDWEGIRDYLLYVTVRGNDLAFGIKQTKEENELFFTMILDALEIMPERRLVMKLRPGDTQAEFYRSEIRKKRLYNVYVVEVTDNERLLNACGVLLTTHSTMAIEALFFEKPIIQLKCVDEHRKKVRDFLCSQGILCDEDGIPLAKYGAAIGVENLEELKRAIVTVHENEQVKQSLIDKGREFLRKYCFEPDGKASLRVLQCINQLTQRIP